MNINVLGTGCATCKKLYELTQRAVAEMDLDTEVEYVTDIRKIAEMGVMSSPVLAINGKPVLAGSLPDMEKLKEIIARSLPLPSQENGSCCADKDACDTACDPDEKNNCDDDKPTGSCGCTCGGSC